jgi:hypothetical protein
VFRGRQEARASREETRAVRLELAASEAERARLVAAARTADLASRALRAQLAEAGAAFRAAMATAQGFLQQGGGLGELLKRAALWAAAQALRSCLGASCEHACRVSGMHNADACSGQLPPQLMMMLPMLM